MDRDTLDLIKPADLGRRSTINKGKLTDPPIFAEEEEQKLHDEDLDSEWEKFLDEARQDPTEVSPEQPIKITRKQSKHEEKERKKYFRRLVAKDILHLTEKKQDAVAPSLYSQTVNENQMISEKEIANTSFNKGINEILNIEIVLLILSRKSLHLSLSSDLEISRWKKFLMKFLKKN